MAQNASKIIKDWEEYVNPDFIRVELLDGRKIDIKKGRQRKRYQTFLQLFDAERYDVLDRAVTEMVKNLEARDLENSLK